MNIMNNAFGGSDISLFDLISGVYQTKTQAELAKSQAIQQTAQIVAQGNAQVAAENVRAVQFKYLAVAGIAASLLILLIKYKAI